MELKSISEIKKEIQSKSIYPEKVKLLAVSKKQSVEKILNLFQQGQSDFGENYLQEAMEKMTVIKQPIKWHFIGHLQSNKIKNIVGHFDLIHSVDSFKKASMIDKRAQELNLKQKILLEINIASEESKSGFLIKELISEWKDLISLDHVQINGFMTLPPLVTDNDDDKAWTITRNYFSQMRKFRDQLTSDFSLRHHNPFELSMGTSHDYLVALEEQATIIRIGTLIFGERI